MTTADVVVIGAGPAGLSAAYACRHAGIENVVVLDREATPGGVPRHCAHTGFGIRDLHRVLTGPVYAAALAAAAKRAGVQVRTSSTATDLDGTSVTVTSPGGRYTVDAGAVVLATGCRERPRSARWVAGTRPDGVYTTGLLQQLVEAGAEIGRTAVVVGSEHVSYSALLTLRTAGLRVVAMVTRGPGPDSFAAFDLAARAPFRIPLWKRATVRAIQGRYRVSGVEIVDGDGRAHVIPCDTVVFTADWVAESELARRSGVPLDPGTGGPSVDTALRTAATGVFAAGNTVHPAETADVCALDGHRVAASVQAYLTGRTWPASVPVAVAGPLRWAAPNRVAGPEPPPRGVLLVRTGVARTAPRVTVRQGDRTLYRGRLRSLHRGRSTAMPAGWLAGVDPLGPPVHLTIPNG